MITQSRLTMAVEAKRAIVDRLRAEADGGLLSGVDVAYGFHGALGLRSVYGGGFRFTSQDAVAEGPGILVREEIRLSLYVRVVARPAVDVAETDIEAAAIGGIIGRVFRAQPQLVDPLVWLAIAGGQGDYSRTDDETVSVHAYELLIGSHLAWG